ncbi:O-antigen/teichoic acid export membrane protein [Nakamurella sp. UYEF19]|uniref:lipopolysaccharide biosynthesis protein n=1 Tax=Nakamurella sp. UYEF19 TaxID=1756392 RepID=UPI0033918867
MKAGPETAEPGTQVTPPDVSLLEVIGPEVIEREVAETGSRLSRLRSDPVMLNTIAIMASTVVTSVLGYVFWIIVARSLGSETSGTGAAITSALQATVLVAAVGAAAAMIEWLPRSTTTLQWRQRVTAGLIVTVVAATLGGLLVPALLGFSFGVLPQLGTATGAGLFCLASVFFALGILIDYIAISERRGGVLLLRNVILTGLRIPLLFVPLAALGGDNKILAAWTIAACASLVVAVATFRRNSGGRTLRPAFGEVRAHLKEMAASLLGQHLITVAAMMAGYLLPILVVARLSPSDNAYFYVTWMLGSVFFIISPAVSTALFAAGAADPSALGALARRSVLISAALLVLPMLVYLFGGGLLLDLFGDGYASRGRLLLILLTLSAIPDAITNIAVSVLRATNRLGEALHLNAGMLALCIVGSWFLLPYWGILAAGIWWLVAQSAGAIWVVLSWHRIGRIPPNDQIPAESLPA